MQDPEIKITNDPYLENFIKSRELSKSSERVYIGRLRSFCEFLGMNPSELIKEARKNRGSKINDYFHDYIDNLKTSGRSSTTIMNHVDTVKAFYKEFDVDIEGINQIISPETDDLNPKEIISSHQIKESLELSCLRDKAIILLHTSSGMEATELRHLSYGDFITSIEEYIDLNPEDKFKVAEIADKVFKMDGIVGTWKITKNRTGKNYVTFNSPESTQAILSYLIDRERKNKPIKSLKDPLFVNSKNQALNVSTHGSIFKRVNNRANFGYLTKKRRFFSSTMLRKYFKTKLYESGIDKPISNALLGQKLDDNIDYHSPDEIKLLKNKYLEALDNLSFEKRNIESVNSEEYNELVKKLDEKDKELKEIKKYLNHIKQIIE